jgi:hypothetical protein
MNASAKKNEWLFIMRCGGKCQEYMTVFFQNVTPYCNLQHFDMFHVASITFAFALPLAAILQKHLWLQCQGQGSNVRQNLVANSIFQYEQGLCHCNLLGSLINYPLMKNRCPCKPELL